MASSSSSPAALYVYELDYYLPMDVLFFSHPVTIRLSPILEQKVKLICLDVNVSILHYLEHNENVYDKSIVARVATATATESAAPSSALRGEQQHPQNRRLVPPSSTTTRSRIALAATESVTPNRFVGRLYVLSEWPLSSAIVPTLIRTIQNSTRSLRDFGSVGEVYQKTAKYTYSPLETQPSRAALLAVYGSFYEYRSREQYTLFRRLVGSETVESGLDAAHRSAPVSLFWFNVAGHDDLFERVHDHVDVRDQLVMHTLFVERFDYCDVHVKEVAPDRFDRFAYYPTTEPDPTVAPHDNDSEMTAVTPNAARIIYYVDQQVWRPVTGLGRSAVLATIPHTKFIVWLLTPHQFSGIPWPAVQRFAYTAASTVVCRPDTPLRAGAGSSSGSGGDAARLDATLRTAIEPTWPAYKAVAVSGPGSGPTPAMYTEINANLLTVDEVQTINQFFVQHGFEAIQWNETNVRAEDEFKNIMFIGLCDEYLVVNSAGYNLNVGRFLSIR